MNPKGIMQTTAYKRGAIKCHMISIDNDTQRSSREYTTANGLEQELLKSFEEHNDEGIVAEYTRQMDWNRNC